MKYWFTNTISHLKTLTVLLISNHLTNYKWLDFDELYFSSNNIFLPLIEFWPVSANKCATSGYWSEKLLSSNLIRQQLELISHCRNRLCETSKNALTIELWLSFSLERILFVEQTRLNCRHRPFFWCFKCIVD